MIGEELEICDEFFEVSASVRIFGKNIGEESGISVFLYGFVQCWYVFRR